MNYSGKEEQPDGLPLLSSRTVLSEKEKQMQIHIDTHTQVVEMLAEAAGACSQAAAPPSVRGKRRKQENMQHRWEAEPDQRWDR